MRKILIIDDQPEIRRVLRRVLEADPDYQVFEAADGQAALEIVTNNAPDAVLLDISMPGMNGIQMIRPLTERSPRSKILILSGHTEMGAEVEALGAHAFIPKTAKPKVVMQAIKRLLAS